MIRFRRALWVALLALGLQPAHGDDSPRVDLFASDPRGPHETGTFEEMWIDQQRDEPTTNDPHDKRHLMVQFWYPATVKPNSPKAPYVLHPELYSDKVGKWFPFAKTVRTTSVLNAPLLASDKPFPVVIYNPGGGNPHFTGTSQAEYLASHGYVVVGIGHTGLNRIERFPDGYAYKLDTGDPEPTKAERETMSDVDAFRLEVERTAKSMMPLHVQDIRFVLDRLQALNSKAGDRFRGRLDLDRVASIGWSLGGALSLQASRDEPRIKAAINLDGWLYTDVYKTGTHRPVMQIHQSEGVMFLKPGQTAARRETVLLANSFLWQFFANTDADWFDVTLDRAHHGHFSDWILLRPWEEQYMHPRLAHEIVNVLTREFLDKYLKGSGDTPFLSGTRSWSQVQVLRKPGQGST